MLPTAIILAGGLGTRLRAVVGDVPKPMAPVRNRPFLDFQLDLLRAQGCTKVILSIGHLAEKVSDHYGEEYHDIKIHYSVEASPLGTGGALRQALHNCEDDELLVLNGDSLFDIDLKKFLALHSDHPSQCSIALRHADDASRFGKIVIGAHNRIDAFTEKSNDPSPGLINAGIYLIDRKTFIENAPAKQTFSIEREFFAVRLNTIPIYGFVFDGYFIDIGIPEDFNRAQHEFARFEYR